MVRCRLLLIPLVVLLSVVQAAPAAERSPVVVANNQFGLELFKQLAAADQENLLVSPLSISTALAMTYAGARGQTEAEMAEVLHFDLPQDQLHAEMGALLSALNEPAEGSELHVANRLWGQHGYAYQPQFLQTTRQHYGAELAELDFASDPAAARLTINDWVEEQTRDRIQDLIPAGGVDELTRLVLTNAIYYHSDWSSQFEPTETQTGLFHVDAEEPMDVPMMNQRQSFRFAETPTAQILEMPYGHFEEDSWGSALANGDYVSMVVLLPQARNGLPELEASLDADVLTQILDQQLSVADVQVSLPKFELTDELGLRDTLARMGMPTAFSDTADFSGISDEQLAISDVLHKAFVKVNEEGTEAAAATGVVVGTTSVIEPEIFRADHPFLFLIRDNSTGSILFMGRVTRPRVSAETNQVGVTELQPGDANQDRQFDQLDLVQVLQAGKYLTAEPATWGEGDWNGAPGGRPGDPPAGDNRFDQHDIMAALKTAAYLAGPQAALVARGAVGDEGSLAGGKPAGDINFAPVPEPSTSALLAIAGLCLLCVARRV